MEKKLTIDFSVLKIYSPNRDPNFVECLLSARLDYFTVALQPTGVAIPGAHKW